MATNGKNENVGKHLRLHPVTAIMALFDEDVSPWVGSMQSRYVDEHTDLDGDGYGVLYETGPATFHDVTLDASGVVTVTPEGTITEVRVTDAHGNQGATTL